MNHQIFFLRNGWDAFTTDKLKKQTDHHLDMTIFFISVTTDNITGTMLETIHAAVY